MDSGVECELVGENTDFVLVIVVAFGFNSHCVGRINVGNLNRVLAFGIGRGSVDVFTCGECYSGTFDGSTCNSVGNSTADGLGRQTDSGVECELVGENTDFVLVIVVAFGFNSHCVGRINVDNLN